MELRPHAGRPLAGPDPRRWTAWPHGCGKPHPLPPQDRFRHGPPGHPRLRRGGVSWPTLAGARRTRSWKGLMTHFASASDYTATADGTDQTGSTSTRSVRRSPRGGRGSAPRTCTRPSTDRDRPTAAGPAGTRWCARGTGCTATSRPARGDGARARLLRRKRRRSPGRPAPSWR